MNDNIVNLLNIAKQLFKAGDFNGAAILCRQAVRLNPENLQAHLFLGTIALKEQNLKEAAASFEAVLKLNQNHLDAHLALGGIANQEKNYEKAISHYRKALNVDPECALAHNDLALIYHYEKPDIEKAFYHINKSLSIDPGQLWPSMVLAELFTVTGDWEKGFKQNIKNYPFYENYDTPIYKTFQKIPLWQGGEFSGKKLVIGDHAGFSGFGDIIMFSRYLPLLKERGGTVALPVQRQLFRLFENFSVVDQLIAYEEAEVKAKVTPQIFDLRIPLIFLPVIFGTSLNNVPANVPYLKVCPDLAASWKAKIIQDNSLKVGLVWNGNKNIARRSCSFKDLTPLGSINNITYYNLQMGEAAKEITKAGQENCGLNIIDLTGDIQDFADTAALITNLDLVISIDTAVAHLAGAIGKPVWMMLHRVADCKWLLDKQDTLWYPTMRIFRSKASGDWAAVIDEIYINLKNLAEGCFKNTP